MNSDKTTRINSQLTELERFPIRVLSEETAVATSTLRAWERRYGLLKPERTPKGHRLYSRTDIKRVLKILDLLNDGHTLPTIADLLSAQPGLMTEVINDSNPQDDVLATVWEDFIYKTIEAVSDFSSERIDAVYNEASSLYPVDMVTDRLVQPILIALGDIWKEHPEKGIAEEHFYTSWLKNRLGARFHHAYTQSRGARIVCACMPGVYHEIGLMLFALSALARGYRVLYFGADLPLNQLKHIATRSAAKAIVLGTGTQNNDSVSQELSTLIPNLTTPVFIGGTDQGINIESIEKAGGTFLGPNISVALKILESNVPAYTGKTRTLD